MGTQYAARCRHGNIDKAIITRCRISFHSTGALASITQAPCCGAIVCRTHNRLDAIIYVLFVVTEIKYAPIF